MSIRSGLQKKSAHMLSHQILEYQVTVYVDLLSIKMATMNLIY